MKDLLFKIKWHWKNRKWKDCRQKRKTFKRDLAKEKFLEEILREIRKTKGTGGKQQ